MSKNWNYSLDKKKLDFELKYCEMNHYVNKTFSFNISDLTILDISAELSKLTTLMSNTIIFISRKVHFLLICLYSIFPISFFSFPFFFIVNQFFSSLAFNNHGESVFRMSSYRLFVPVFSEFSWAIPIWVHVVLLIP